jgi:hypothetical protein
MKNYSLIFLLLSLSVFAESRNESIKGVELSSYKKKDERIYRGEMKKNILQDIEKVKLGIINFDQKCNNKYKSKRKFLNKENNCTYHNENLIETVVKDDIKKNFNLEKDEQKRYILLRHIYNRGTYSSYDLTQEYKYLNDKKQPTIKIVLTMMKENEVKEYMDLILPINSAFNKTISTFTLTQVAPNNTEVLYEYEAHTDHWILSKEISVSQVFDSISRNVNELWTTIITEATKNQIREVATRQTY